MSSRTGEPGDLPDDEDGGEGQGSELRPWAPEPWWRNVLGTGFEPRARLILAAAAVVVGGAVVAAVVVLGPPGGGARIDHQLPHVDDVVLPSVTSAEVQVHVAGAVLEPGVYRLPAGGRVADVVDAAGGFTPDAEPDRINLAAELRDGSQVFVPRVGEAVDPAVDPGAGGGAGGADAETAIDVNTAGAAELERLPGIGPTLADAIVRHREMHGPFATVDDLTAVAGIGPAKLEALRDAARV